jgi:hypothetical protein
MWAMESESAVMERVSTVDGLTDARRRQIVRQRVRMSRQAVVDALMEHIASLRQQLANCEAYVQRYRGVGHE